VTFSVPSRPELQKIREEDEVFGASLPKPLTVQNVGIDSCNTTNATNESSDEPTEVTLVEMILEEEW
jgi:hypothetical protein